MAKYRCDSCGATYNDTLPDGAAYAHVCSPEVVEHAKCDDTGRVIEPEKRTPRQNIRNENISPGLVWHGDAWKRAAPHPEERGRSVWIPAEFSIISEGDGRTRLD